VKNPRYLFAAATLLASLAGCEVAQAQPELTVELVASGLGSSLYVTAAPGDDQRLFVVEQSGLILVILNGEVLDTPFLDIADRVYELADGRVVSTDAGRALPSQAR